MAAALVSLAVADRVALLSMERPPVNAMSRAMMSELGAGLDRAAADPAVHVIVVTSGLPGMFSGGADIRELEGLDAAGCAAFIALGQGLFSRMGALPKPIIAAINGACVGGGMELSMACDLRVAAESARFGQPEVNLGVVSGWGGTQRLPRLVGKTRGLEMLLLGEQISADEALAMGLVNRVVPDDMLVAETTALARRLAAKSPVALAKVKETVERGLPLSLAEGLREEARCYVEAYVSDDAKEGLRAFLEKRPARFPGR
ncbi:MAG: enoyl-CoA hydratase/isomerase family protein [Candidatus Rokubacteria bacterium]|nr:enoyl-CoA hydratase/isomerase family protein [Candidatus Rokubacteria bacterium]